MSSERKEPLPMFNYSLSKFTMPTEHVAPSVTSMHWCVL